MNCSSGSFRTCKYVGFEFPYVEKSNRYYRWLLLLLYFMMKEVTVLNNLSEWYLLRNVVWSMMFFISSICVIHFLLQLA